MGLELSTISPQGLTPSKKASTHSSSISSSITSSSSLKAESPVISKKPRSPKCLLTVQFQWNGNASEVFLTGSFAKWATQFIMIETQKNQFEITLNLPPGEYEYKYIVDGEWKVDESRPVISNKKGEENNYLLVIDNNPLTDIHKKNSISTTISEKSFTQKPIKCPSVLTKGIRSAIEEKSYNENKPYAIISNAEMHTTLNHLRVKKAKDDKVICVSSAIRYRQKAVTICYYKPNRQIKKE